MTFVIKVRKFFSTMTNASTVSSTETRRPDLFCSTLSWALPRCLGQYLMGQPDPLFVEFAFTKILNTYYRWDIYNLDNVIVGVVLFVIGGCCCSGAAVDD